MRAQSGDDQTAKNALIDLLNREADEVAEQLGEQRFNLPMQVRSLNLPLLQKTRRRVCPVISAMLNAHCRAERGR